MAFCEHCERLKFAVLDASKVNHNLLAILDVTHDDFELTAGIQQHIAKSLTDRDDAIRALKDHENTHTK